MDNIKIVSQEDLDKIYSNQEKILIKLDKLLSVKPPVVIPDPEIPIDPNPNVIDWVKLSKEGGEVQSGFDYYIPEYSTNRNPNAAVEIKKIGDKPTRFIFGKKGYSKWSNNQDRYLFETDNPFKLIVDGIDMITEEVANEVDPFYITIFKGSGINQSITLRNLSTNMERALMYGAANEMTQKAISENIMFNGFLFEELKTNSGNGIISILDKCELNQINPPNYFESTFVFENKLVHSTVPFSAIENSFHSQQYGNACNILFVDGMTFILPWGLELSNFHDIRPIPNIGDEIELIQNGEFLQTTKNSLQSGDILEINGKEYTVISKDRPDIGFAPEYPIDINIGFKFNQGQKIKVIIKKSNGLKLIGKSSKGWMIFKDKDPDNKKYNTAHFQTSIHGNQLLEYYLSSNPLGVLIYNKSDVSVDWKNSKLNGYLRISAGEQKRQICITENCEILKGQFVPC